MIGVFDSGVGGLTAVRELKRISPSIDICFYADRKNAPYGTKTENELVDLVSFDIEKLISHGASKVLMACCTASTVYPLLDKRHRGIACPIISPTARKAARITENGKIAVIATEATVRAEAFKKALIALDGIKEVTEIPTQELVSLVESGARDDSISNTERSSLNSILSPIKSTDADTLILGCTHFPHLEKTIAHLLPNMKIVSSSLEGALEILKNESQTGSGKTLFI